MCFTILCSCILHFSLWSFFVVISVVLFSCNAVLQVAWASFSRSFGFGLWVGSTCSSDHLSAVTSAAVSRLIWLCFCLLRFCGSLCRGFDCVSRLVRLCISAVCLMCCLFRLPVTCRYMCCACCTLGRHIVISLTHSGRGRVISAAVVGLVWL